MSEEAKQSLAEEMGLMPCPHCGSTDLVDGSWCIVDDEEVAAVECNSCKAGAPWSVWNQRPDPWRYPPELPADGQRVLYTYVDPSKGEVGPLVSVYDEALRVHCDPIGRWMPVPAVTEVDQC